MRISTSQMQLDAINSLLDKQSELNKAASDGQSVGSILTEFGTAIIGKWLP